MREDLPVKLTLKLKLEILKVRIKIHELATIIASFKFKVRVKSFI